MSRFSVRVIKDVDRNFENIDTISFNKGDTEYPQHMIENIQEFIPIYSRLLDASNNTDMHMCLNHRYHVINGTQVYDIRTNETLSKELFVKYSPLLDPLRYMIGKYEEHREHIRVLPTLNAAHSISKLDDVNNSAYTDGFFYYLTSMLKEKSFFPHGIDYYGSQLAIQKYYKINVEDDLEYLSGSQFFNENIHNLFVLTNSQYDGYGGTCKNKDPLKINTTLKHNFTCCSLEELSNNVETIDDIELADELIYENMNKQKNSIENEKSEVTSETDSSNSSLNYSSTESKNDDENEEESQWETEDSEESEESTMDEEAHAIIYDYPVQMICLEKCEGTLDSMFENCEINEDNGSAILFQIIMILLCYQKVFHFTHNDLHTNNIMYNETSMPYLYYKYKNQYYKIPTNGKLFKLIDFGRSIYKFDGKTFCSDSFAPSGDASSQYNCEPYMNEDKPRIDPNMSFDLCRLGCSIYDFIIHDDNHKKYNELQKTIVRWCSDDSDKNILYKKNGDDRYPNFKLYKMIARNVHKHTPDVQLEYNYFNQYQCDKPDNTCMIIDIDSMVYHG